MSTVRFMVPSLKPIQFAILMKFSAWEWVSWDKYTREIQNDSNVYDAANGQVLATWSWW